jgi:hypothetical protein
LVQAGDITLQLPDVGVDPVKTLVDVIETGVHVELHVAQLGDEFELAGLLR